VVLTRAAVVLLLGACAPSALEPIELPCAPGAPAPYPSGSSYLGVHGNRGNDDVIACASASAYLPDWHALEGLALSQPNTFSPDGTVTYAATFQPTPDGCNVHAVSVADGSILWCRTVERSVGGSAVEVDEDGNLYFTADRYAYSLTAAGEDRWRTDLGGATGGGDFGEGPLGVHFLDVAQGGHVATVTNAGVVYLLSRATGAVLASLDLPAVTAFVPPRGLGGTGGLDLSALVPESVRADLMAVFGEGATGGLGAFLGAGGGFSDNTLGVSSRGQLFVTGGGPDPDHGALIQVHLGGTPASPSLTAGWALVFSGGSASSPSITPDGRFVSVGDGSTLSALLDPRRADAHLFVADVEACDANTDSDPLPERCAPFYGVDLERGPIAGSPPLLSDGTLMLWELSVSQGLFDASARDVAVIGPGGPVWQTVLPDALDWTSVLTVTSTHVIGTASRIEPGSERISSVRLPRSVTSFLTVLDRSTGALVFRAPVPDDASATVTIGPDGSLYVGMLGLLQIFATDTHPTLGLVRFRSAAPEG
jgi:hypothetical protein